MTAITADEWLQRKGSVGRPMNGEIRICDDSGEPVPPLRSVTVGPAERGALAVPPALSA
jgi:hypothetical protein